MKPHVIQTDHCDTPLQQPLRFHIFKGEMRFCRRDLTNSNIEKSKFSRGSDIFQGDFYCVVISVEAGIFEWRKFVEEMKILKEDKRFQI